MYESLPLLSTKRLRLRRASAADLDALHAIMADPETMRYWSTTPHADRDVTSAFLASIIPGPDSHGDEFIIEQEGTLIGKIGIWRSSEIGFILGRPFWGKGFATEALTVFIDYAFAHVTDHLTADVDPRNRASLALLRRTGFAETGRAERTWNIAGEWSDSVYLRRDREPRL
jgi:RimJ/RimL family protein N-acetyltransferase